LWMMPELGRQFVKRGDDPSMVAWVDGEAVAVNVVELRLRPKIRCSSETARS
jgi:hypothetical protein